VGAPSPRRVVLEAPAKVNLALRVGARRPDGYHELASVFLAFGWTDVLAAEARAEPGCTLALSGPAADGVPSDGTNLACRAAEAVLALARRRGASPGGVHLRLEKRVPSQAGLGGGSSDAAAAARATAALAGIDPDDPELGAALAALGSDVVFFIAARASGLALCTGRGERVEPWEPLAGPLGLAVVTPAFGCATAAVYAAHAARVGRPAPTPPDPETLRARFRALAPGSLSALRASCENDLEPAALAAEPRLVAFREHLERTAPGAFHLAGSGSSWFGFFPDPAAARDVVARLEAPDEGRRFALRARWAGPAASHRAMPCDRNLQ